MERPARVTRKGCTDAHLLIRGSRRPEPGAADPYSPRLRLVLRTDHAGNQAKPILRALHRGPAGTAVSRQLAPSSASGRAHQRSILAAVRLDGAGQRPLAAAE